VRILVADDEPVSLRLMERMLQNSGYTVITVDNGREAAQILSRADGPRMALIDWMMPVWMDQASVALSGRDMTMPMSIYCC
jgi:two-component system cell cycle response regulator